MGSSWLNPTLLGLPLMPDFVTSRLLEELPDDVMPIFFREIVVWTISSSSEEVTRAFSSESTSLSYSGSASSNTISGSTFFVVFCCCCLFLCNWTRRSVTTLVRGSVGAEKMKDLINKIKKLTIRWIYVFSFHNSS